MNIFKVGLLLNNISLTLDRKNYEAVKDYIKEVEKEVITDNWTLCSDELPSKANDYLVLWIQEGFKGVYYEIQEYCNGEWCINMPQAIKGRKIEIIAWQKLPDIPEEVK